MRQLSPATNLVLSCLGALGLAGSLRLPWLAPALAPAAARIGGVERAAADVAGVFRTPAGARSGAEAFPDAATLLLALLAVVAGSCAAMAVPAARGLVREPLRWAAASLPVVVAYVLVARPGGAPGSIGWGAFVALAAALLTSCAAWRGSTLRRPRPAPATWAEARRPPA